MNRSHRFYRGHLVRELRLAAAVALAGLAASGLASGQGAGPGYPPPPESGASPRSRNSPAPSPGLESGSPGSGADLDELMRWEKTDMKVAPVSELRKSQMHAPTPNQIPGGQLVTTKGLVDLLPRRIALVFDVLGGPQTLPGAIPAVAAAQPGTFDDQTQQTFGRYLQQVTQGRKDVPLVFYCQGPMCWMSYNAALRAIQLGYKNVLWYRGGLEAWQKAGKPLAPAPAPQSMNPGGGGQPPAQRNQW